MRCSIVAVLLFKLFVKKLGKFLSVTTLADVSPVNYTKLLIIYSCYS